MSFMSLVFSQLCRSFEIRLHHRRSNSFIPFDDRLLITCNYDKVSCVQQLWKSNKINKMICNLYPINDANLAKKKKKLPNALGRLHVYIQSILNNLLITCSKVSFLIFFGKNAMFRIYIIFIALWLGGGGSKDTGYGLRHLSGGFFNLELSDLA